MPPSGRPDGQYRWLPTMELEVGPDRLPEPPAWLVDLLDQMRRRRDPAPEGPVLASGTDGNPIPEGQRNGTLTRLAGGMRRMGMSEQEIAAALLRVNQARCVPPLDPREVQGVAASVARYEPDQIAVAVVEDHFGQDFGTTTAAALRIRSLGELVTEFPDLRPPLVHGLIREGESANIIAAPKVGKSWLATDLALAVATGGRWLDTFQCEPGDVLVIDNELHEATSANRIPKVAQARCIPFAQVQGKLFITNLRGHLRDLYQLNGFIKSLGSDRYKLIVLDAFYRLIPKDSDENDNGAMANLYNQLDCYAAMTGAAFIIIHHTSKGDQSLKSITDLGSGAGAQSRAPDAHIALRYHEEDEAVVMQAEVRTWKRPEPLCLRCQYPVWMQAPDLDPAQLRSPGFKRREKEQKAQEPQWTPQSFTGQFVSATPRPQAGIIAAAERAGLSNRKARSLLALAEGEGLVHRWRHGPNRQVELATVPQP